jgi:signal transduction histidine kinase
VEGDEERLVQLLVNVLDNAVKYTRKGTIGVSCHPRGDHVLIDVRDTGIGISKEDLPHIFDRFFRADKARTRSEGGTGLGLAISKWIVEQHGGTIRADSEPDQGTAVHIVLPRK